MTIEELIELVKLHGKSIYGFCFQLTGSKEDTDDLYQETFLKALELRHKLDASRNPKAFLIAIAIRLQQNYRLKLAWRRKITPTAQLNDAAYLFLSAASEASPEESLLSLELRAMIRKAASKLNDKLKHPLYMHYTADMTIEEIAEALRIPQGTVKSRLHKARKMIKQVLEVESL
ncbi:sigma-70 family RNA polymerase sigma factor [Paenibacillus pinisoli]|uniref:Sigma-70 family RNA polymerase sigma factor n=1 Tax=Paenibacillus pinisoli TaxID=1276110 RepID=A0A3A6PNH1_9BACL|nr:sigma-70 family RNA polymerase sigma factor [Paenibacillus pinisoli]RJX38061.1 sigma-70 family RNA polymerase sigma factor [Paenibacillus pinisoli]